MDMTQDIGAGPWFCPIVVCAMTWKVTRTAKETYIFEARRSPPATTAYSLSPSPRSWLPNPIGRIYWIGMDDTIRPVYAPMYCGIPQRAPQLAAREPEISASSAGTRPSGSSTSWPTTPTPLQPT